MIRLLLLMLSVAVFATTARASTEAVQALIRQLFDPDEAEATVGALVEHGDAAVPALVRLARASPDMSARGWAIVALREIEGERSEKELTDLHDDDKVPMLVRTWAAAARVQRASSTETLVQMSSMLSRFPALDRPIKLRLSEVVQSGRAGSVEDMLRLAQTRPQLQSVLVEPILSRGPGPLMKVMFRSQDQNLRRQAAAYLGSLAQRQGPKPIATAVAETLRYSPRASEVPWHGGPLFIPGIQWPKTEATKMVGALVEWHLFCERKELTDQQKQIHNNIRSLSLAKVVGYQSPGWQEVGTVRWLEIWGKLVGKRSLRKILERQDVHRDPTYSAVLGRL